jgi:hypothetical protein
MEKGTKSNVIGNQIEVAVKTVLTGNTEFLPISKKYNFTNSY